MEATAVELEIILLAKNTRVFRYFVDMHLGLVMFENQYEIENKTTLRMVNTNKFISELFIHLQYIIFQCLKRIVQHSQQVWESTNTVLNILSF